MENIDKQIIEETESLNIEPRRKLIAPTPSNLMWTFWFPADPLLAIKQQRIKKGEKLPMAYAKNGIYTALIASMWKQNRYDRNRAISCDELLRLRYSQRHSEVREILDKTLDTPMLNEKQLDFYTLYASYLLGDIFHFSIEVVVDMLDSADFENSALLLEKGFDRQLRKQMEEAVAFGRDTTIKPLPRPFYAPQYEESIAILRYAYIIPVK